MTPGTTSTGADHRARLLESLAASGARIADDRPSPRVAAFGSVSREHRALVESAGLLEGAGRVLLRVEGDRATGMLDGLLTNHLESAAREERALYSFLLTAKGRPVADLRVVPLPGEEAFWLDLPGPAVQGVEEHLGKYLPPRFASFARELDVFRLSVVGPEASRVLAGVCEGPDPGSLAPLGVGTLEVAGSRAVTVRREPVEGPGFDLYVAGPALRPAWDALLPAVEARGGAPAGHDAREILRVERGVPAYGAEITADNLPQETGQEERAISFEKGCYTGQEVVVRIQHRGHVNRHLRGLVLEGEGELSDLEGASLHAGDRRVGGVTSAVRSPRFGIIGLGYVRREVEPGGSVALAPEGGDEEDDGGSRREARVVELPFTDT